MECLIHQSRSWPGQPPLEGEVSRQADGEQHHGEDQLGEHAHAARLRDEG